MIVFAPDSVELLKRMVCVDTNRHQLCIGAVSGFSLAKDMSALPTDSTKLDLWELASAHMGKGAVLDEGYPKAAGEFLAYGACYANQTNSNRQPVSARITVGPLSKQLAVFGDRTFNTMGSISAPLPFSRMALTPENAFGGPDFADNPHGKGFLNQGTDQSAQSGPSLPNVENPAKLISSSSDRPLPAGFWALVPDSPRRMRHLGTFDEAWKRTRWPHFPMDTDAAYFQAAPEDQRLNGYFVGDERIEIQNMHPQAAVTQTNLPGQRLRVLIARNGSTGDIEEYKAHIDTVWLFVDALAGFQLFRSVIPTKDADGEDITHLYLALESLRDAPVAFNLHVDHFRRLMAGNEPDAQAANASMTEQGQASGATKKAGLPIVASMPSLEGQQIDAAPLDGVEDLEQSTQEVIRELDIEPFEPGSDMATFPPELAALLGLDASKPVSELQLLLDMKDETIKSHAQLREVLNNAGLDDPKFIESLRANPETVETSLFLQSAPSTIEGMMQDVEQGLDEMIEFERANPTVEADETIVPVAATAEAQIAPEEESINREWVIKQHQNGKSMAGYDLSGLDLSNLDLRKADFGQATLSAVNFTNTRLEAAIFQDAILERADFTKADLTDANLRGVTAQAARLPGANLTRASLREADFTEADFSQANLDTADLKSGVLSRARLQDAVLANAVGDKVQLDEADCSRCDFTNARLQAANFYGSLLTEARLKKSDCRKSDFSAARAQSARFESADLSDSQADFKSGFDQAIFISANLSGANWHKASLKACNFDRATLTAADLTGSNLSQAILIGTQAKNLCLDRCDLTSADLSGANLFEGSMRSSNLQNAKMISANLFGADFLNAHLNGADWRDSIIARTVLEFKKP